MDPHEVVEEVFSLFENYGTEDYIGEVVNQQQHALQAAKMAEKEGYPTPTVLGSLLHDIGHLVGMRDKVPSMVSNGITLGTQKHEILGTEYLRGLGFGDDVTDFVQGHVDAKRYLVAVNRSYQEKLSEPSRLTMAHQGGPMTQEEVDRFKAKSNFEAILRMRTWDEAAKDPIAETLPIEHYKSLCLQYLQQRHL